MASLSISRKEKNQNIQVFARLRPINARERDLKSIGIVEVSGSKEIIVKQAALDNKLTKRFTFDRVFGPNSKQVDVYQEVVSPLIEEVLAGYNCTVFAYGQTGTGKTHTMVGESSGDGDIPWQNDPMSGIIPRSLSQLFDELRITNSEYTVRVSYLELYNEELFDLLSSSEDNSKLRIYEDVTRKGSNIVNGLEEMTVYNKNEVYKIMEKGQEKRRIASTLMNAQSSRSHTVFTIVVHMKENSPEGEELMKIGKLNLVDLAGSENISKAGSDNPARKERARECVNINQSLLTLGRVITALVERHPHIPYRESKLTRLLQESLGGRTKTSIIATISPGHRDVEETLSTLEYAHRARNIQNKPEINQKMTKKAVLKEYSEEIDRLKRDLQASRERNGIYLANETYAEMTLKIEDQEKEIQEQILFIKAMKEEKDKIEGLFSEISDNLKETENQLNMTNKTLNQTKVALSDKNQELLETKNEVEEQKYLVHKQVETEKILMEQAKTLIDVADTTKKDVELLHSTVEKKRALEYNNLNVAKTFGDNSQSHRTHIKDHVNEFSKSHLEHLSKLQENLNQHDNDHMNNQIASKQIINEMCEKIKEMFTITNNAKENSIKQISECTEDNFLIMQNINESSYVNVNDNINKLLALLVRLNDAREQDRLSVEQMKIQVRQWKDTSKAKILSLRHVNSEWWNDINNHMKHLEEQFEVNTNTHLQDNQALLELRKEYDDEISSDVAKLREMIVSLEEKQIKHKNTYNDMQQKHRSSMVLSKELYANTLLHGKETLSSKIQGVNNIVDMLDEVNKTSVKDITSLVEDYDKIIDIGKIINSDFKNSLDEFAKSNTEYWTDSLNKTKDAKNNIKQTQEKCIVHHHASFNEFLNRCHSETCNILNPIEDTIQNITKNAGEIEQEFHHLKISMGDFHTKLQNDLVINDDLEMKFLTEDYKLYSPTGKTPIRREYLYPRNIKNTSPHERILMRLRNSRNKKFIESSPLQIDHVIDLDQTIEMTPLKRTVENSQSETNHIINGMITPIILDSPDVVFTEPKPVHNSSLQNNSTTTSPPNDDIYDANDFKQSKENLNISTNDKKEILSKLRQPSSVKKILGSKN